MAHAAVFENRVDDLRRMLLAGGVTNGADAVCPERKNTLLYVASRFGKVDVVRMLLDEFHANVNKPNDSDDQSTPLHGACFGGHPAIVAMLLERGANIKAKNAYGELPMHNAKAPAASVAADDGKRCVALLKAPPPPKAPVPLAAAPVAQPPAAPAPPAPPVAAPVAAASPAATAAAPEDPKLAADRIVLNGLALPEIRKHAAAAGVAATGTKATLIERIIGAGGIAKTAQPSAAAAPAAKVTATETTVVAAAAAVTTTAAGTAAAAVAAASSSGTTVVAAAASDDAWIAKLRGATFTKSEVPRDTEEFWALEERVMACNQGHNDDYVTSRLKKKKKPLTFIVKRAWRVVNPVLEEAFKETMATLTNEDKSFGRVRAAFHGTKPEHIDSILTTSLLRFQHPLNPCKEQADDGYFGTNKKGVYVSRYFDYTLKYSNGLTPLDEGQTAQVIMFKCLPGKSLRIDKLNMGMDPTPGYNSHSSPSFLEWYLFDERQLCPEYVVELQAKIDTRTAADDE